jgi:putative FmdB family regulatory protein
VQRNHRNLEVKIRAMPTYSYACKSCEHAFDVQQAISDEALTKCPKCGGELRKVFGQVGVTFKGTGFYRNDSGSAPKGD